MGDIDKAKNQIPGGGAWYPLQAPMLEAYRANDGGFTVAWDTIAGKGSKAYGLYPSPEDFYANLLRNPPTERFGYELIPENMACKAYADVEWMGKPDPNHTLLKRLITFFRKRAAEWYPDILGQLEVYVACGSRSTEGGHFKHSYHVTIHNLVFPCNHDNLMKRFFTLPNTSDYSEFYWTDAKGSSKCAVDMSVYSRNRVFSLPYNTKRSCSVPLLRLSNDPYDDDLTGEYNIENADDVLPMVLTNIERGADTYYVPLAPEAAVGEPASRKRQRNASTDAGGGEAADERPTAHALANVEMPLPKEALKAALEAHGDVVSRPSSFDIITTGQPGWAIQCNQGGQPRQCLVDPSKTHDSNNCMLFLLPKPDHTLCVEYFCTAESCKHKARAVLGRFELDPWCRWTFVKRDSDTEAAMEALGGEVTGQDDDRMTPMIIDESKAANTYEQVKAVFERTCFKVRSPFAYAMLQDDMHTPDMLTPEKLKSYFANLYYYKKGEDCEWIERLFINRWVADKYLREVRAIVVDPTKTRKNVYNMWCDYIAATQTPVEEGSVDELVAPIVRHIHEVMTDGNTEHTEWMLDWFANIVQRPHTRSKVAIMLFGAEGAGKGIIIEWMRLEVLGDYCTYQTADPENDIVGRFANGLSGCVLAQIDEVKSLHQHVEKMKNIITDKSIRIERKGKDMIKVDNLLNFIYTSNNENALTVSANERRHVLFRCSSKYKGNHEYFNALGEHLSTPGVSRAFYQFLMRRNLSAYKDSFQHNRPITEYYMEAQERSISVLGRFLSGVANSPSYPNTRRGCDFYTDYRDFCSANGFTLLVTITSFGLYLKKHNDAGISKDRGGGGQVYTLYKEHIKAKLQEMKEYDEEACVITA